MKLRRFIKRSMDLLISTVGIMMILPILLLLSVAQLILQGRPILHASTRAGQGSRPFNLLKFRTMSNEVDPEGNLLPDGDRLTRFGRLLRTTSLDELPQLFNILRGDMSLIGPRPLPVSYVQRYSTYESRRLRMRPGLTGLAQVQGRNSISWQKRFSYDITYVERWTWRLEIRILIDTFKVVLGRRGISNEDHATMPEFVGTDRQGSSPRHASPRSNVSVYCQPTAVRPLSAPSGLELLAVELERTAS